MAGGGGRPRTQPGRARWRLDATHGPRPACPPPKRCAAPQTRDAIVPVNKRHDLGSLLGALARLYPRGNAAKRRVLIEYIMLEGVNDTLDDAQRWVGGALHNAVSLRARRDARAD